MIKVIVCGVAGRMGGRLANLVIEAGDLDLAGGTERPGHEAIGKDLGTVIGKPPRGITVADDLAKIVRTGDVVLNFTSPEATVETAKVCGKAGIALVAGTTGLSAEQVERLKEYTAGIPCVYAPNYSIGVNLLFKLVEEAARILGDAYDVEIVETHHRFKKDAPSGTALRLAEKAAAGLSRNLKEVAVYGREGMIGERKPEEIAILAVRAGDTVGDHTVIFGGLGERVELVHRAHSRDTFAMGALRAVRFAAQEQAGFYDMGDVLGIK